VARFTCAVNRSTSSQAVTTADDMIGRPGSALPAHWLALLSPIVLRKARDTQVAALVESKNPQIPVPGTASTSVSSKHRSHRLYCSVQCLQAVPLSAELRMERPQRTTRTEGLAFVPPRLRYPIQFTPSPPYSGHLRTATQSAGCRQHCYIIQLV
jgi:hypothetical protein